MRKIIAVFLILLFSHTWCYRLIGWFNRRYGWIDSVFLMYPASARYLSAYCPPAIARYCGWRPVWVGIGRQTGGGWMLIFAVPNVEKDFLQSQHHTQLQRLVARMQQIQQSVGATQSSFAGILPSVLAARQMRVEAPERAVTVTVVVAAVTQLVHQQHLTVPTRLIVLGGAGFIGTPVVAQLRALGHEVAVVDPQASTRWPDEWVGLPTILLNISRKNAIYQYIDQTWSALIVLNEVYPEPSARAIQRLSERGVKSFHLVGVAGQAWPHFPASYHGAIPCCAGQVAVAPLVLLRRLDQATQPHPAALPDAILDRG